MAETHDLKNRFAEVKTKLDSSNLAEKNLSKKLLQLSKELLKARDSFEKKVEKDMEER